MKRFRDWFRPTPKPIEPTRPVLLEHVEAATPPDPSLELRISRRRARIAQNLEAFNETAADIRMALAKGTLELRGHK